MSLLPLVLGAAAAGGLYLAFKEKGPSNVMPPALPGAMPGIVNALEKNGLYVVQLVFDTKAFPNPTGQTVPVADGAAEYITSWFTKVGFKPLSQPQTRDPDNMKKFLAGDKSLWVLNAQWLKDDKYVTETTPAIPTAEFIRMPANG